MHDDELYEPCSLAEAAAMADDAEPEMRAPRFRARQGNGDRQGVVIEQRQLNWWDDDPRYDATTLPLAEAEEFLRELQATVDAAREVRAGRWWNS